MPRVYHILYTVLLWSVLYPLDATHIPIGRRVCCVCIVQYIYIYIYIQTRRETGHSHGGSSIPIMRLSGYLSDLSNPRVGDSLAFFFFVPFLCMCVSLCVHTFYTQCQVLYALGDPLYVGLLCVCIYIDTYKYSRL